MTFPNHPPPPPPPPFLPPPPFAKVDFYRQNSVDNDDEESNSHPSKRPRTLINPQLNPNNFPRVNPPNPLLNRGTGYIFYKTRLCLKFIEGNCRNGESCTFAHGAEDLREPPPNWQEIVGRKESNNNYDDQRNMHRFKICKKYANGEECPYGENCNFLHKRATMPIFDAELDGPRESSAIRIGINGPMTGPMNGPMTGPMNGSRNGPMNGYMDGPLNGPVMGLRSGPGQVEVVDSIENMHGVPVSDDSRVNVKPVYWKTKMCSKWEITGYCPFGDRCHFAHGQADLQLPGVRIEAEAMNMLSTVPAAKSVFVPPSATTEINTAIVAPTTNNGIKKLSERWKGPKKINTIYGDWLDGMSPPRMWPKNDDN